jgi:Tfp pilus assembly protein PilN
LSATGLAIKALNASSYVLNIDLFPVEAAQLRATVKRSLIAANIIAAVLFVMFVVVGLSNWRTSTLYQNTLDKKTRLLEQTHNIAERRISLDGQIRDVSKKLKTVNEILEAHRDIPWPGLLNDVAHKKPKTVCLTGVESITDGRISLKGMAISNEDIYLFVNTLNESENIDSALIYETKKDTRNNGLVSFEVRCTAKLRKKV